MANLRDCKLWKECKTKDCIKELKALYGKDWKNGSIIWSKEVCYALNDLKKKGLVKTQKNEQTKTDTFK